MGDRTWLKSIKEAAGDAWVSGEAILSALATAIGVYQNGVAAKGWPAFPYKGFAVEPWHFFTLGYLLLGLSFITAFHKLGRRLDSISEQLDDRWRIERKEFEKEFRIYRGELAQFLDTLRNLLIQERQRQVITTWREYLPSDPTTIDPDFFRFAQFIWSYGSQLFGGDEGLRAFKERFRIIHGFFDRVHDLAGDFPNHAPHYIAAEVQQSQYEALHVVWYFGHALGWDTYGADKPRQYASPPRWDRLWHQWNPGAAIPQDPQDVINALEAMG